MRAATSKRGQVQVRTGHRAPHGQPEYTDRIAIYCTPAQKRAFKRNGYGSPWLRKVIDLAIFMEVKP